MTDAQAMRVALNLHTRTIVMLVDAVERADTPAERSKRLAMIRDAALDYKADLAPLLEAACRNPTPATSA